MPLWLWAIIVGGSTDRCNWSRACGWMRGCTNSQARGPRASADQSRRRGPRQPSLAHQLLDTQTQWQEWLIPWYGGQEKKIEVVTGVSLWYRAREEPLPIRWVLIRCPEGRFKRQALFCTDTSVAARHIVLWFIARWNIEVTFEELRAHLGFETQRQWSDRAIARTTPCLFGLFSLVVVMAKTLHPETLPIRQTSWYWKEEPTFSDALAAVRSDLWHGANYSTSAQEADCISIPQAALHSLVEVACYST